MKLYFCSLTINLHRMQIKKYLDSEGLSKSNNNSLIIYKQILDALPSQQAFSIMGFVAAWNAGNNRRLPRLEMNDDMSVADAIIGELLPHIQTSPRRLPVLTTFQAKFRCCACGKRNRLNTWESKSFDAVPMMSFPSTDGRRISVGQLLQNFMQQRFDAKCSACASTNNTAVYEATKGN